MKEGLWLLTRIKCKKCKTLDFAGAEPDFFKRREGQQACHLVELKAGYSFDTKKASIAKK